MLSKLHTLGWGREVKQQTFVEGLLCASTMPDTWSIPLHSSLSGEVLLHNPHFTEDRADIRALA